MQNFKDLQVWEKAHRFALIVYRQTDSFPRKERYGLTSQMRRCSVSTSSNIAEGCGRGSQAQLHRFLEIAMGSVCELESQLLLSCDLDHLEKDAFNAMETALIEIERMLTGLIKRVRPR